MVDEYRYDKGLHRRLRRLIERFPDSFGHIDPNHILAMRSDKEGYRAIAEVRKIQPQLYGILPYRVMLIVYDERYRPLKKNVRTLVEVHELTHIGEYKDNTDSYVLRRHDVEDWAHMVGLLGVGWTQHATIDIMKAKEDNGDWEQAMEDLVRREYKKKNRKKK